jgi:ABC-type transport system involved in multi-copper enzyme maturation permease subunit
MTFATIVRLELLASLRRRRFYATLVLLVAIPAVATRLTADSYRPPSLREYEGRPELAMMQEHWAKLAPQRHAARDRAVFAVVVHLEGLAVLSIAPLYAATAIAAERERHTLEPLLLSDLRDAEIILGRWLVRLVLLGLLLLAGLPVLFASGLVIGRPDGVSSGTFWSAMAMLAALSLFGLGLGLLASTVSSGVAAAALMAMAGIAIVEVALPIIGVALLAHPSGWIRRTSEAALSVRPGVLAIPASGVLRRVLDGGPPGPDAPSASIGGCLALLVGLGVIPLAMATFLLRRVGLRSPAAPPRRRERRPRRTRHVWADPVAWRELRTVAAHRRMAGVRMAALIASALFGALSLATWIADLWDGHPPRESDVGSFQLAIALTAMIAWLVVALQGSVSIGSEVRNRTLDSLLLTPISGRLIVRGKLAGAVISASFALAFPMAFAGLAASRGVASPRAALFAGLVILAAAVLFAAIGLTCSLRFPTGPAGAGSAVTIVLALCLGVPAAAGQRSGDGWRSVSLASPLMAAYHLIADESAWPPNPGLAAVPEEEVPPSWARVARNVALWAIAWAMAMAVLVAWCRRRIERDYRIRQRPLAAVVRSRRAGPGGSRRPQEQRASS